MICHPERSEGSPECLRQSAQTFGDSSLPAERLVQNDMIFVILRVSYTFISTLVPTYPYIRYLSGGTVGVDQR